jgi:hypothetical protein
MAALQYLCVVLIALASASDVLNEQLFLGEMSTREFLETTFDNRWLVIRKATCYANSSTVDFLEDETKGSFCNSSHRIQLVRDHESSGESIAIQLLSEQSDERAFKIRDKTSVVESETGFLFDSSISKTAIVSNMLAAGQSLIYKPELAEADTIIDLTISQALEAALGSAITTHAYISAPGRNALSPHSDVRTKRTVPACSGDSLDSSCNAAPFIPL